MTSRTKLFPRVEAADDAVRATVEIAAPPERVFEALTDPQELAEWWGSAHTYRTRDWRVDARPGGAWSVRTTDADGREATVDGEYRVVDPPRVLELTWRASWDDFVPTVVRYELAPVTVRGVSGTRITVTHTGVGATACATSGVVHGAEWLRTITCLATYARAA